MRLSFFILFYLSTSLHAVPLPISCNDGVSQSSVDLCTMQCAPGAFIDPAIRICVNGIHAKKTTPLTYSDFTVNLTSNPQTCSILGVSSTLPLRDCLSLYRSLCRQGSNCSGSSSGGSSSGGSSSGQQDTNTPSSL